MTINAEPKTQEVEIIIKITVEVATDQNKDDIKAYIGRVLRPPYKGYKKGYPLFKYAIIEHDILSIREEAEIYDNK